MACLAGLHQCSDSSLRWGGGGGKKRRVEGKEKGKVCRKGGRERGEKEKGREEGGRHRGREAKRGRRLRSIHFRIMYSTQVVKISYISDMVLHRYIVMHASTIHEPPLPNKMCRTRCYAVKSPTVQTVFRPMPGLISYCNTGVTRV